MSKQDNNITQYPNSVDTRVALLEMSISHINETLMRIDHRFDKIDQKLDKLDSKIDSRFFWLLSMGIVSFTGLFAVMAHGFKWF